MAALLADGWFYISSAGLLVSGVLFFFLLGQYRAAGDAADQPEAEAPAENHSPVVRPLSISEVPSSSPKLASIPHEKPAEKAPAPETKREAAPLPAPAPAAKPRETTTGGINPAVVYLQNIKNQLEEIHGETRDLTRRVEAITSRDEALIERLAELTQAVAELKGANNTAAAAPVEQAAPKRAKKAEAPAVAKAEAPAPAPVAAPVTPPTLVIEPTTPAGVPQTQPEAKPEPKPEVAAKETLLPAELFNKPSAEPTEDPESADAPRRGPVWPV